jgi:hypothetical protein
MWEGCGSFHCCTCGIACLMVLVTYGFIWLLTGLYVVNSFVEFPSGLLWYLVL